MNFTDFSLSKTYKRFRGIGVGLTVAMAIAANLATETGTTLAHMGHTGGGLSQTVGARGSNGECLNPYSPMEENMSRKEKIEQARQGGPHVSADAKIMARNRCGVLETLVEGKNGFVCLPNADPVPVPNPVCLDDIGFEWYKAAYFGLNPKPTNPGIGYMALGGGHWEIQGKVFPPYPKPDGAVLVRDPPHWMLLWEYLPGCGSTAGSLQPNAFGERVPIRCTLSRSTNA